MQPAPSALPRAGYLGPEGTFSEEALLGGVDSIRVTPVPLATIRDAVMAVQHGEVEWSLVSIVGEVVLPVRHYLIARTPLELEEIETIVSHPHVPGQCTRFLQERLPRVRVVAATSTAEAVRLVGEREQHVLDGANRRGGSDATRDTEKGGGEWAAIGTRLAADVYGCAVIAEGIQDRDDNETRFVWLARTDSSAGAPPLRFPVSESHKTSLVFWGAGADRAGWLVLCLDEFARRGINLTKIESRPMRERLGHYMFFVDLEGSLADEGISDALAGLRDLCEQVRVFGSYPTARAAQDSRSQAH